ncbi:MULTISPECIES: 16S rRNA (guanine(527)-N(7))-methyltransferase RsmG [unclassified Methylophaga]|mgnify:CR=1 FL=1|jgi:16S rRNA (guanine527-N7)-methyltransferase|uniref:16S rRNA (guanine(527)-N(7))-methyltransferase RsmG n=2 Tax=Methylophaga TaxID=40222 RepID=UPI000C9944FB|nr:MULTISPECIES: 16S rRNA (guanine(527)-N(7))-methyltransferase RsmG [unclassified Methylophaga]MAK66663.1 16S rRNA (guanine(527)-N(7))-methyltransferase RsmG [Methylophaga sp.]MAY17769.1 16S rRNA (guanine(527)-N(7))-methyltransferase RsmG [Methylophaga sp.]|tara:strand:+ start:3622 stop:4248 length:627 start_codon:yes stop_codon:yes gene_type:complete
MGSDLKAQLDKGCAELQLQLSEEQKTQLLDYLALLQKWNKVYNLTSVRDPQTMLTRHILDSLSLIPYLNCTNLLDVGSGAGLPGIPIAICFPQMSVTLLDSNIKKTRFLQQVKAELKLNNVTVIHGRVEQITLPKFDVVTARAFATIAEIIDLAARHCDDAGSLVLMKGVYPEQELAAIKSGFKLQDIVTLNVPGDQAERHLVRLIKD